MWGWLLSAAQESCHYSEGMTDGSRLELTHISFAMDDDDGGVFEDRPTLAMELYPTWGDRAIEYTTKAANQIWPTVTSSSPSATRLIHETTR